MGIDIEDAKRLFDLYKVSPRVRDREPIADSCLVAEITKYEAYFQQSEKSSDNFLCRYRISL